MHMIKSMEKVIRNKAISKASRGLITTVLSLGIFVCIVIMDTDAAFADAGSLSYNTSVPETQMASLTLVEKNGRFFDYRTESGQVLYGYDTLQGACANNGYAYLTLYNRDVEKCKIVKVDLASRTVIKVSKALPIYHGNNLTYNTRKNLIVATCCRVKDKRAVFIDPNTLKVKKKKNIKLTRKVKGLPKSVRKKYKGFTAIAYNEQKNCYIGRLRNDNNVIIFDGNMKPKKYVRLSGKNEHLLNQGMESIGNYIYDVRSFKGVYRYNVVTIHTLKGEFAGQMVFPYGTFPGNELQCIFHDGKQFYAGFYNTTSQANDTKANHVMRLNRLFTVNNLKYPE